MNKYQTVMALGISLFYLVAIGRHLYSPGTNFMYTRMLLFACITTPAFIALMLIGNYLRDQWIGEEVPEIPGARVAFFFVLILIIVVGWINVKISMSVILLLFFAPFALRLWNASDQAVQTEVGVQIVIYFIALISGSTAAWILQHWVRDAFLERADHFSQIWPMYNGDRVGLFISICLFAALNQLREIWHGFSRLSRMR